MKLRSDYVYEYRPTVEEEEEKELVAMAVDAAYGVWESVKRPASSYDVAAVTPGLNVNKEKSLEQETEDDARSTTSTIESDHTEEEYPSENEDFEDFYDEDEKMEESKQVVTLPPMKKEIDEEVESIVEDSDSDDWDSDDSGCGVDRVLPDKNDWVASWNTEDPRKHKTWIDVYAYFRKEQGDGGYGVILRSMGGKPIVASAKHSGEGKSFFYQVLLGIKAGLVLADTNGISDRSVRCNSIKVPDLVLNARRCRDDNCKEANKVEKICKWCLSYLDLYVGSNMEVLPLVQDLKRQKILPIAESPRVCNEAAHYLAKMAKNKRLVGEIKPDAFPQNLKDILWEDVSRSFSYWC
ncbi:uncharacterized protein LOC113282749 [Papaver somniferum]|uniref:uncharacterized protein LOC113282749 n=1 Tax=Papaver somniferum TaxID=3469 RepID=UPI000E6F8E01|nr:uncharacterized protein LOC113282749 [Papaver somniferum]XP_026387599.1 uncharacterized protein LOC113282749 [Papaver somniferum]